MQGAYPVHFLCNSWQYSPPAQSTLPHTQGAELAAEPSVMAQVGIVRHVLMDS